MENKENSFYNKLIKKLFN